MIVAGFVVEYNPFHNGHLNHLKKSIEISKATHCIGIMSGNFIQRGGPAIFDKWNRASLAILNGVDLILELPLLFASQSADFFAKGSISTLDKLNIVDYLVFGSESNKINKLITIANELAIESDDFKSKIKLYLGEGITFPKAREIALKSSTGYDLSSSSNDILAIEYIKQIILQKSKIIPMCIQRQGSSYNSNELLGDICSATAIRESLKYNTINSLKNFVPITTYNLIESLMNDNNLRFDEDFYPFIRYSIIMNKDTLNDIFDIEEGLHNKIYNSALESKNIEELLNNIKSKRYTYTRLRRIIFNILLNITKKEILLIKESLSPSPYARVLAFNEKGRELLNILKQRSSIPIINKVSHYIPENDIQKICFYNDMKATRIYNLVKQNSYLNIDMDYKKSPSYIRK